MKRHSLLFGLSLVLLTILVESCSKPDSILDQSQYRAAKTPLMGWSSWNAYMVNISDSIICREADLLVKKGLRDKGFAQVNIDDGFFGFRTPEGKMTAHAERFPDGMKKVVDYVHSLGMKAGIYSDAGDNTCGSYWNKDATGKGAGLYAHDVQDADLYFNEWGFDFIKIDYCGAHYLNLDAETRYFEIKNIIDSVANKNISINICRWAYPGTWVSKAADSWRTTGDINPNWNSLKHIIKQNLYLSGFAANGHYNDMDMLALGYEGNGSGLGTSESAFVTTTDFLTRTEEETHFGLWCILNSPLLLGCKLDGMPQHTFNLVSNEELIALNQDPLGLQAHVVQHEGETYVFTKDLLLREGPERAVALYNSSEENLTMKVLPEELGFKGSVKVRDLIEHKNLGKQSELAFEVPAHGVKILKVKGQRFEPCRYEAEWAYLSKYSMIEDGPYAAPSETASGRTVIKDLGEEGNYLEWSDIISYAGGDYRITLVTENGDGDQITITINGENITLQNNECYASLKKGYNTVRLSSPVRMPDIDCLNLYKK